VQECPVGLETELLSYATFWLRKDEFQIDPLIKNDKISSLVHTCVSSPIIFQVGFQKFFDFWLFTCG